MHLCKERENWSQALTAIAYTSRHARSTCTQTPRKSRGLQICVQLKHTHTGTIWNSEIYVWRLVFSSSWNLLREVKASKRTHNSLNSSATDQLCRLQSTKYTLHSSLNDLWRMRILPWDLMRALLSAHILDTSFRQPDGGVMHVALNYRWWWWPRHGRRTNRFCSMAISTARCACLWTTQ